MTDSPCTDQASRAWLRSYAPGRGDGPAHGTDPAGLPGRRADADRRAAWRRWHQARLQERFERAGKPWFAILERARVEVLAGRALPGMAHNLAGLDELAPADPAAAAVYRAARRIFAGQPAPGPILPPRRTGTWWMAWRTPPEAAGGGLDDDRLRAGLQAAARLVADPEGFAFAVHPLVDGLAAHAPVSPDDAAASFDLDGDETPGGEAIEVAGGEMPATTDEVLAERLFPAYRVYSRQWDEERPARHFLQPGDTRALDQLLAPDRQRVRQLAHRLQRRLRARQLRHWSFDQEQGLLDPRRLGRLLVRNGGQAVFRVEEESLLPEACVSLLVDQSGSMTAERRLMAALAIDLAVHSLQLCRIRCEVLGYTTRYGPDNPVAASWRERGGAAPGRLNALRHIIYKHAGQPWRQARAHLGLMLRADFGHENIDGESLYWAARRLLRRPEPRKLLIVLSDGAPFDAATAQANGRAYLEEHLRQVIARIEAGPLQLLAIGTGRDAGRFYRHACTVRDARQVPEVMLQQLGDLLTTPLPSPAQGRGRR